MSLSKLLAYAQSQGASLVPPALLPPGFTCRPAESREVRLARVVAFAEEQSTIALAEVPVKEFTREVRGKEEVVRPHQEMTRGAARVAGAAAAGKAAWEAGRQDWPHPDAVGGHKVAAVFTHPKTGNALYDLGHGLHAEGVPGKGGQFKPGAVMRSNTGLDKQALAEKGWKRATPPRAVASGAGRVAGAAPGARSGKAKSAVERVTGIRPGQQPKQTRPAARKPPLPWAQKPGGVVTYKDSLGIDRSRMPQVSGTLPGGKYASSAELRPKFLAALQARGVPVTHERVPAGSVRPTQTTGDAKVIRGIAEQLKSGELADTKPVVISSDHRIIDGHHNWAGRVLAEHEGAQGLREGMPVIKLGLPADRALAEVQKFADSQGIKSRATGVTADPAFQRVLDAAGKGKPQAPPSKPAKLSDSEYATYRAKLEDALARGVSQGLETHKTETLDGSHLYKPERAAIHDEIIKEYLARYKDVPSEGRAIIAGGLGGAGKSSVLKKDPDVVAGRYATVNPDDMKEELAKRGLVPELPGMPEATPMERTGMVHEESSHIAKQLARQLQAQRKNMVWDITMSSPGGVQSRLDELKAAGYSHTHGVFVHIPVEKSVESAALRHRAGLEEARSGKNPLGERYVPSGVIRASARVSGSNANRDTFDQLRPHFSSWDLWDRSDMGDAKKVSSGGRRQ